MSGGDYAGYGPTDHRDFGYGTGGNDDDPVTAVVINDGYTNVSGGDDASGGADAGGTTTTGTTTGGASTTTSRKPAPYPGMVNPSCLCYLNSLLQTLYHTPAFRWAVFSLDTSQDEDYEDGAFRTPKALQALFYNLSTAPPRQAQTSTVLTKSFGWTSRELSIQHDIQELLAKLRDSLAERMKQHIHSLMVGMQDTFVHAVDGSYENSVGEPLYDVQVQVQGFDNLSTSLDMLLQKDIVGDYKVEYEDGREPEKKDIEKGTRFRRFPPIVFFHLKRFEMDMESPNLDTKKVNTRFEFPKLLDLTERETKLVVTQQMVDDCQNPNFKIALEAALVQQERWPDTYGPNATEQRVEYKLYSVLIHSGGVGFGHYTCNVRDFDTAEGMSALGRAASSVEAGDGAASVEPSAAATADATAGGATSTAAQDDNADDNNQQQQQNNAAAQEEDEAERAERLASLPAGAGLLAPTRWYCYNDSWVDEISEQEAIDNQFGGVQSGGYGGYSSYRSESSKSAYMLSYARKSLESQIFFQEDLDQLPKAVKDDFAARAEEDRKRREEEERKNKLCHVTLITTDVIKKNVERKSMDLIEINDVKFEENRKFECSKDATLDGLYDAAAAILGQPKTEFRLHWWLPAGDYDAKYRVHDAIPPSADDKDTVRTKAPSAVQFSGTLERPWNFKLYVENKLTLPAPVVTNAATTATFAVLSEAYVPPAKPATTAGTGAASGSGQNAANNAANDAQTSNPLDDDNAAGGGNGGNMGTQADSSGVASHGPWDCPSCTFTNEGNAFMCEVCQADRPDSTLDKPDSTAANDDEPILPANRDRAGGDSASAPAGNAPADNRTGGAAAAASSDAVPAAGAGDGAASSAAPAVPRPVDPTTTYHFDDNHLDAKLEARLPRVHNIEAISFHCPIVDSHKPGASYAATKYDVEVNVYNGDELVRTFKQKHRKHNTHASYTCDINFMELMPIEVPEQQAPAAAAASGDNGEEQTEEQKRAAEQAAADAHAAAVAAAEAARPPAGAVRGDRITIERKDVTMVDSMYPNNKYDLKLADQWIVSSLKIAVPVEELPQTGGAAGPAPAFQSDVPRSRYMAVKHYSFRTHRIDFCGFVAIPITEYLESSTPMLRAVCGVAENAPIRIYEEKLGGEETHISSKRKNLVPKMSWKGDVIETILIVQEEPPAGTAFIYDFPYAPGYLRTLGNMKTIQIMSFEDPKKGLLGQCQIFDFSSHDMVAEAIGKAMNLDWTKLRLHGSSDRHYEQGNLAATPKQEPYLSYKDTARHMIGSSKEVIVFYELLDVTLKYAESIVEVEVHHCDAFGYTHNDEAGQPLPPFSKTVRTNRTMQDLATEILTSFNCPFETPHVFLDIQNHVIENYCIVLPRDKPDLKPINVAGAADPDPKQEQSIEQFFRSFKKDKRFELRVFPEADPEDTPDEEKTQAYHIIHGEFHQLQDAREMVTLHNNPPPCFMTIPIAADVHKVHSHLKHVFSLDDEDLNNDPPERQVMLYIHHPLHFSVSNQNKDGWNTLMRNFFMHNATLVSRPKALMVNYAHELKKRVAVRSGGSGGGGYSYGGYRAGGPSLNLNMRESRSRSPGKK